MSESAIIISAAAAVVAAFACGSWCGRRRLRGRLRRGELAMVRRRCAMAAQRETGERFGRIVNSLADGAIIVDGEGRIVTMNPAAAAITGCSSSEAAGRQLDGVLVLSSMKNGERVGSALTATLATGEAIRGESARIATGRDGHETSVVENTEILRDADGEVAGAVLMLHDVTSELRLQREAEANRELMNRVCARTAMSFFRYNMVTKVSTPLWNTDLFRLVSPDGELVPIEEWLTSESLKLLNRNLKDLHSGRVQEVNIKIETCYRGVNRWYNLFCTGAGTGNPDECLGMMADITASERQYVEHLDTLTMLNSILDNLPFPVFTKDADDNYVYLTGNRAMHRLLSLPDGGAVGRTDYEVMGSAAEAARIRENDEELVKSGRDMMTFSETFDTIGGRKSYFNAIKQMIELGDGRRVILGVSVDVTAEREAALRAESTMKLLRTIIENLPVNIYVKDFTDHNRFLLWNSKLGGNIGLYESIIGRCLSDLKISDDMRAEIEVHDHAAVEAGGSVVIRRMMMPTMRGGRILCDVYKRVVKSPEGHDLIVAMAMEADSTETASERS
ncbi:MAG: PAS domain-containing protein [Victivallaceae bacterium]|nr:PAS domain-containing protein [Victivallaceae bacterium]